MKTFLRVIFPIFLAEVVVITCAISMRYNDSIVSAGHALYALLAILAITLLFRKCEYVRPAIFQTLAVICAIISANLLPFFILLEQPMFLATSMLASGVALYMAHYARKVNGMHASTLWEATLPTVIFAGLFTAHMGFNLWISYWIVHFPLCIHGGCASIWHEKGWNFKIGSDSN